MDTMSVAEPSTTASQPSLREMRQRLAAYVAFAERARREAERQASAALHHAERAVASRRAADRAGAYVDRQWRYHTEHGGRPVGDRRTP